MYDIRPLEEEWKKYQRKKRQPWYMLAVVLVLVLAVSVIGLNFKGQFLSIFVSKSKTEKRLTEKVVKEKNQSTIPKHEIETVKAPVKVVIEQNDSMEIVEELPIKENRIEIKKPVVRVEAQPEAKHRKKMHLNIIETSSVSAYKDVAERFRQSHETDDSLFLAKAYYKKGNYKKAEYWALQTNKVNENIEESWMIFARSKIKQGKRNEAVRVLSAYVKRSNSLQAKHLLEKIKQGSL